ncbi:MAG: 50S ribosomal protein L9 [Holosporaceae bacterium]|jgi:large subunit ribosomal protein L9|nr:50S ribosomal protein L9 [Holosporaceae bacterium]
MEHVKVILLQRVTKLGAIGDSVNVKPGFARNYLLPKKIALRATRENIKYFDDKREQIEAANAETRASALEISEKMRDVSVTLVRQASEKEHLYGSVTNKDISIALKEVGFTVKPGQINLNTPIKMLGIYDVSINLHPEVAVNVKLVIAKSAEEAQQQVSQESIEIEPPEDV